jgi:beta-RFAP synthase
MICVNACSRLHFGVFTLPPGDDTPRFWVDAEGRPTIPARYFGGVGLMIREPGVEVAIEPASSWTATGPAAERALAFAKTYVDSLAEKSVSPFAIHVRRCPPQHTGCGVGTQLALAVGTALAKTLGKMEDAVSLARRLGRGRRSGIGVHGFAQGGFLVEGGKKDVAYLAPLIARQPCPLEWTVLLITPPLGAGEHGLREEEAFRRLNGQPSTMTQTDTLCRLALMGLLPALVDRDLLAFGEALYDFNRRVGELFRPWQGGVYAHPLIEAIVHWLRGHGVRGVGQSSWGPTVFAFLEPGQEKAMVSCLKSQFSLSAKDWMVTQASNSSARIPE